MLGKGHASRERLVYFGKRMSKALWKLLTPRLKDSKPDNLAFTVGAADDLRTMTRDVLRRLPAPKGDIGERAGAANVYPYRFRHTFAITYLRKQGDLFTLQELLGHSDMGKEETDGQEDTIEDVVVADLVGGGPFREQPTRFTRKLLCLFVFTDHVLGTT